MSHDNFLVSPPWGRSSCTVGEKYISVKDVTSSTERNIHIPKRVYWFLFLRRSFPIILFIVIRIPSQYPDRVQKLIHKCFPAALIFQNPIHLPVLQDYHSVAE